MRSYHATAALTRNGTVLIAGCDNCDGYMYTRITSNWLPNTGRVRFHIGGVIACVCVADDVGPHT
jgi:hypothetical protein